MAFISNIYERKIATVHAISALYAIFPIMDPRSSDLKFVDNSNLAPVPKDPRNPSDLNGESAYHVNQSNFEKTLKSIATTEV